MNATPVEHSNTNGSDFGIPPCDISDKPGNIDPYPPRQRVIVFKEEPIPGGTLGYYGIILRLLTRSVCQHPTNTDLWKYLVYVPFLRRALNVVSNDLYATGGLDLSDLPLEGEENGQDYAFHIGAGPSIDLEQIHGTYRIGPAWFHFTFRKSEDPHPAFQLRLGMKKGTTVAGTLSYEVPANTKLDIAYVLRALAEVLGTGTAETGPAFTEFPQT